MSEAGRRILDALVWAEKFEEVEPMGYSSADGASPKPIDPEEDRSTMEMRHHLTQALRFAEHAFVTPEMCGLLIRASETVPPGPFTFEDLPWPNGFVVLPRLVGPNLPWYFQWHRRSNGVEALVQHWPSDHWSRVAITGFIGCQLGETLDEAKDERGDPEHASDWRILDALWLLLQQRIALAVEVHADRPARRRFLRNKREVPILREITLRKAVPSDAATEGAALIDWSHRWLVGGHWRAQYYPSDDTHRRIWIAPYVKGPEDRPLVMKDRLYVWRR